MGDFGDRRLTMQEYGPKLVELAKSLTGARDGYLINHLARVEPSGGLSSPTRPGYQHGGARAEYARFSHADFGPESPPMWRRLLTERFGVPEGDAQACDLCMLNIWHPWDRPAYRDPLCLLDMTSVNLEKELLRVNHLTALVHTGLSPAHIPGAEEIIRRDFANLDGTSTIVGPIYSPEHRWVYLPDMRPEDAWVFKQYDTREGLAARCCFHNSFHDPFYDSRSLDEIPARRSAEFRVLLLFPKTDRDAEKPAALAAASKL